MLDRSSCRPVRILEALVTGNLRMAEETEGLTLDVDTLRAGVLARARGAACRARSGSPSVDGHVVGQLMITYEWSDWRNGMVWWIQSVHVDAAAPQARDLPAALRASRASRRVRGRGARPAPVRRHHEHARASGVPLTRDERRSLPGLRGHVLTRHSSTADGRSRSRAGCLRPGRCRRQPTRSAVHGHFTLKLRTRKASGAKTKNTMRQRPPPCPSSARAPRSTFSTA